MLRQPIGDSAARAAGVPVATSYVSSGSFNPDELRMLSDVYRDVCRGVENKGSIALTAQVHETIAITIFNLASEGACDPERMWCSVMREVEALTSVQ